MALAVTDIVSSATSDVTGSSTTRTVTLPTSGVTAGMMMVICMNINKSGADIGDVLTTPGSWNKAGTQILPDTASTPRMYVYWIEVPGGGLGSSVDITSSDAAIGHVAVAYAIDGADVTALDVFPTPETGTGDAVTMPAATATGTGGLILRYWCADDDDETSHLALSAHTAIDWEEQSSPSNGSGIFTYVAVQPSTTIAQASITQQNAEQWGGITFVVGEGVAGVTVTDVETDEDFDDKDTSLTITGTLFEASKGSGKVELGNDADYATATKIEQTTTAWGDTSIDFTADLSTLTPGPLWIFVTNDSAQLNDPGFAVTCHRAVAFTLAASTYIAASGEATTYQLNAPSGKSTTDFVAGRIQDDENPCDAVNITEDDYTELEWCITATANAEGQHEFRTVLSDGTEYGTYTIYPKWTISSGTTYYETPNMTATGTLAILKQVNVGRTYTSTGSLALAKEIRWTRAFAATGTLGLTKIVEMIRTYAATGTVALARASIVQEIHAYAATGTAALSKIPQLVRTFSATATASVTKEIRVIRAYTATGTASLGRLISMAKAYSATGTAAMTKALILVESLVYTATGTMAHSKIVQWTRAFTATATAAVTKEIRVIRAYTATGTASMSKVMVVFKTFTYTATGALAFSKTFIEGIPTRVRAFRTKLISMATQFMFRGKSR